MGAAYGDPEIDKKIKDLTDETIKLEENGEVCRGNSQPG